MVPDVNDQLRRRSVGAPAARSVLLTMLGEYVLPAPGGAWQETLIGALGTLGYKTHAARQALAGRVSAGGLAPRAPGPRRGALAGPPHPRDGRDAALGRGAHLLLRRAVGVGRALAARRAARAGGA